MPLSPVEYIFFGMWVLQILSAAVSAMPKPKRDGWYSWFYGFSHILTNNLDAYFEKRFGVHIPRPDENELHSQSDSTPPDDSEEHTENPTSNKEK